MVADMQQPYVGQPATMTYGDWAYLLLAFVIFSVSLAITRRQFANLAQKTNVRKAIKNKFEDVFGNSNAYGAGANRTDRPESVDSLGFGSDGKKSQGQRDQHLITDGDDESIPGRKKKITYTNQGNFAKGLHYLQSSVGKVIGAQKGKNSDDEGVDPCEYEVLDDCNTNKHRRVNLNAEQTKTVWTKEGPKTVDEQGKIVKKKQEESKQHDVFDGSNEGDDQESPVALLSAMDLNCDDDQIDTMLNEAAESGSRGQTEDKQLGDLNSSLLKKLNKKPVRKAAVIEDDEPDLDNRGELSTATDQATVNHVVDELNDLMLGGETHEMHEQAFMKIDEAL